VCRQVKKRTHGFVISRSSVRVTPTAPQFKNLRPTVPAVSANIVTQMCHEDADGINGFGTICDRHPASMAQNPRSDRPQTPNGRYEADESFAGARYTGHENQPASLGFFAVSCTMRAISSRQGSVLCPRALDPIQFSSVEQFARRLDERRQGPVKRPAANWNWR
jgi:hypothetical protein